MAKLTAKTREQIPSSAFALPGRQYPIEDRSHARAALSLGARYASPAQYSKIRSKVAAKFGIGKAKKVKLTKLAGGA